MGSVKVPAGIADKVSAPLGRCRAKTRRGQCLRPLLLVREGEGQTLHMAYECPEHGRKWTGTA